MIAVKSHNDAQISSRISKLCNPCLQMAFVESPLVDIFKSCWGKFERESGDESFPPESHWLRGGTKSRLSLLHTTNWPTLHIPFCEKEWVPAVVYSFPLQSRKCNWFTTACMRKKPLARVRAVNHLSDHISDTYLRRHLHHVLHFIRGRWPGSKNKALPGPVTMQILTLCQPVTKGGSCVRFCCFTVASSCQRRQIRLAQILCFEWHSGICLSWGLCCHSDKSVQATHPCQIHRLWLIMQIVSFSFFESDFFPVRLV